MIREASITAPLLCVFVLGCASTPQEGSASSAPSRSTPTSAQSSSTPVASSSPSSSPSASPVSSEASPEAIDAARVALTGETAKWFKDQGFTFVCTERVYPPPPNPHLTWWGWASPEPSAQAFSKLNKAFPGAAPDAKTHLLEFLPRGSKRPTIVVMVAEVGDWASPEGVPMCKEPLPKGTKTFVNVSDMPL